MSAGDILYFHFDIPIPGRWKTGGATLAIAVAGGVAITGVALRSPRDQLWRKKGRQIAAGRMLEGTGRAFTFGVPDEWTRKEVIREATRLVLSSIRWQDYPFNRWMEEG